MSTAGYIAIGALLLIVTVLMFLINVYLGIVTFVIIAGSAFMYFQLKSKGSDVLKEIGKLAGLNFEKSNVSYGKLTGKIDSFEVEVKVERDFSLEKGIGGLVLSSIFLESAQGVLAGIENLTIVKVKHGKKVKKPGFYKENIWVDNEYAVGFVRSNSFTGLPADSPQEVARFINDVVKIAKQIE